MGSWEIVPGMSCLAAPVKLDWLLMSDYHSRGSLDLERESFVPPCVLQRAWGQEGAMLVEIWEHFVPYLSHTPNLTSVFCWTFSLILCFWRCRRLEYICTKVHFLAGRVLKGSSPWLWYLVQMGAHMAGSSPAACACSALPWECVLVHCWDAFPPVPASQGSVCVRARGGLWRLQGAELAGERALFI